MKRSRLLSLVLRYVYQGDDFLTKERFNNHRKSEYDRMFRDSRQPSLVNQSYSENDRLLMGQIKPLSQQKS